VEETQKVSEALLGDLSGFKSFSKDATDFLEELRAWKQDTFSDWSRDIQAQIDDHDAPLRYNTPPPPNSLPVLAHTHRLLMYVLTIISIIIIIIINV